MPQHFAKRLQMARNMRGLSMQGLADKLNGLISKQAIGKYELGGSLPRKANLLALAQALDVKLDFFDREAFIDINPSFRKLDSLAAKKKKEIIELTRDYVERYLKAEHLVGERLNFDDYQQFPCESLDDAEIIAEKIRAKWNLGHDPLHNIVEILEEKGIKVFQLNYPGNDFFGLSSPIEGGYAVIVINQNDKLDRQRFTALHELAHLVMSFPDRFSDKQIESLCNRFAGAMLMPRDVAFKELGEARKNILLRELIIIKQQYGISPQAMIKRAAELGIIKEHLSKEFFQDLKARDLLKEEIGKFYGLEETSRFKQIIFKGVAEGYLTSSLASSLLNITVSEFRDRLNYDHATEGSHN